MDVRTEAERATPEKLRTFATAVLKRAGMTDEDASICAEAQVWSDLRGSPGHGVVGRLPQTVECLDQGVTCATPKWAVVGETPAAVVLDADGGWGQVAGTRGMRLAIAKARSAGIGAAIMRNVSITAALGWYPAVAVAEGMIGLAINDTVPVMPPWGGATKLLGNQAFAIGAPAKRHPPVLFDTALAAMSYLAIHDVDDRGELLPPGTAMTADGQPTVDPVEAMAGMILPAGGHRGYGLALMWEILTGVLAGGLMAPDVGRNAASGRPMGVSMFCLAIDPAVVMPGEAFVDRVDALIDAIHAVRPLPGVQQVRVPGERGYQLAEEYARDGVPLAARQAERLRALGERLDVPWDGWSVSPRD